MGIPMLPKWHSCSETVPESVIWFRKTSSTKSTHYTTSMLFPSVTANKPITIMRIPNFPYWLDGIIILKLSPGLSRLHKTGVTKSVSRYTRTRLCCSPPIMTNNHFTASCMSEQIPRKSIIMSKPVRLPHFRLTLMGLKHMIHWKYRKISNIRRTKSPNLNVSRLALQLSLLNSMKPCVKSRMKM